MNISNKVGIGIYRTKNVGGPRCPCDNELVIIIYGKLSQFIKCQIILMDKLKFSRLGVLGAFNLGTDDAPGCAGLYDSITVLEWVQANIK